MDLAKSEVIFECVVNVSEGRDDLAIKALALSCTDALLNLHQDPHHNRSVFTLAGLQDNVEQASRALSTEAIARLDLRTHQGVHPRFGILDVVPFVPFVPFLPFDAFETFDPFEAAAPFDPFLTQVADRSNAASTYQPLEQGLSQNAISTIGPHVLTAIDMRNRYATWLSSEFDVPCFLYGPMIKNKTRNLPEIRRSAYRTIDPDLGPLEPDPHIGSSAIGARGVLIAYNIYVEGGDISIARSAAKHLRCPSLRALGFELDDKIQVSFNLIDPYRFGIEQVYDLTARYLEAEGVGISSAELVGLLPSVILNTIPTHRWRELGLSEDSAIEARLEARSIKMR